jgi:hypothetical protein
MAEKERSVKNPNKKACQALAATKIRINHYTPITYPIKILGIVVMLERIE